jgi:hypothetical protein
VKPTIPPLLRGIGTLLVLIAALIAFCIARNHDQSRDPRLSRSRNASNRGNEDLPVALASEVRDARPEVEQETVVHDVLDNRWFDWVGFAGTAVIAASFFAEAYLRREKSI